MSFYLLDKGCMRYALPYANCLPVRARRSISFYMHNPAGRSNNWCTYGLHNVYRIAPNWGDVVIQPKMVPSDVQLALVTQSKMDMRWPSLKANEMRQAARPPSWVAKQRIRDTGVPPYWITDWVHFTFARRRILNHLKLRQAAQGSTVKST